MQFKKLSIIISILLLLLLLLAYYYNDKRSTNGVSPNIVKDVSPNIVKEENNHTIHKHINIEPNHTHFYHPSKPEDIWVSLYNKRLVIRRLAYYDNRDPTHHYILFNSMYDLRIAEKPNIYVYLNYKNAMEKSKCLQLQYKIQSGNLIMAQSEIYVYFLLSTSEPLYTIPYSVYLSTDPQCKVYNSTEIPVRTLMPSKGKEMFTYGVCLHKGLFNIKEPQALVDWVEMNKALGAQLLTIYFQEMPPDIYPALLPYIHTGLVEVIDWNLRAPTIPDGLYTWDYGMSGVINECIYRNMNRVKYLSLSDIDEYIAPESKFKSVPEMLTHLESITSTKPVSAYQFHNTYYFIDKVNVPQLKDYTVPCADMKIPRYFARTQRATQADKYGSDKLIVHTRAVHVVQVHYVVSAVQGYIPIYNVPNDIGRSNHYRWPYRMENFTPHEYCDVMGRFAKTVLPQVEQMMCKVNNKI